MVNVMLPSRKWWPFHNENTKMSKEAVALCGTVSLFEIVNLLNGVYSFWTVYVENWEISNS